MKEGKRIRCSKELLDAVSNIVVQHGPIKHPQIMEKLDHSLLASVGPETETQKKMVVSALQNLRVNMALHYSARKGWMRPPEPGMKRVR